MENVQHSNETSLNVIGCYHMWLSINLEYKRHISA